jgi:hypothetical protein
MARHDQVRQRALRFGQARSQPLGYFLAAEKGDQCSFLPSPENVKFALLHQFKNLREGLI